jgi:hypothetical protein
MSEVLTGVPVYRTNIYSTDAIVDPYPHYSALRRLGPVVWLPRHRVYALPRFTECKATLRDDGTFISEKGVALNRLTNRLARGTTLNSDGADHDQRRSRRTGHNPTNRLSVLRRHGRPLHRRSGCRAERLCGSGRDHHRRIR